MGVHMRILCIDPGPVESGFVIIDEDRKILRNGIERNRPLCNLYMDDCNVLVIEMVASYGMPVGKSTFLDQSILITRKDVKKTISSGNANDANIRQAMMDRYPGTGGGAKPEIGTKKRPGPLYGMKSHMWQALALGHAYLDGCKHYEL